MIENKEQIYDIYDVWYEPLLYKKWFVVALVVSVIILVSMIIFYFYRKYKNKIAKIDVVADIQEKLSSFTPMYIEDEQDCKKIYFEISMLLKKYIAYRYHVSVKGLTDSEIIAWASVVMPESDFVLLKELLLGMPFIKFEHRTVTTQRLQADIRLMQDFIQKTTPV